MLYRSQNTWSKQICLTERVKLKYSNDEKFIQRAARQRRDAKTLSAKALPALQNAEPPQTNKRQSDGLGILSRRSLPPSAFSPPPLRSPWLGGHSTRPWTAHSMRSAHALLGARMLLTHPSWNQSLQQHLHPSAGSASGVDSSGQGMTRLKCDNSPFFPTTAYWRLALKTRSSFVI